MIIKKIHKSSYVPKGHPRKCKVCNSWLKNQTDGPPMCLTCHFRNKAKEDAERREANPEQPIKPNVRIGKI